MRGNFFFFPLLTVLVLTGSFVAGQSFEISSPDQSMSAGNGTVPFNATFSIEQVTGAIEETPLDKIKALFEVNVLGAVAMIQAVLPGMRQHRSGHIINITSVSGLAPWAGTGIYGASKYAMECIGQTLADEVQPLGIHVTNVAPGGMRTDFSGGSLDSAPPSISDYDLSLIHI